MIGVWTLAEVEHAVRVSWGADTCDAADRADWHPGNPARGQCGDAEPDVLGPHAWRPHQLGNAEDKADAVTVRC